MSIGTALLRVTLLTSLLLLLAGPARAQLISPGPLARSHADLDGESGCDRCHASGKRVLDQKCLDCHKRVATALAAGRGFHAKLVRSSGKPCAACHPDHQGRAFPLIRWDPKKSGFSHDETGFPLRGAHEPLDCKRCHRQPDNRFMVGSECVACHEDVHRPTLGRDCAGCHDDRRFVPAPRFDHDRARYRLEGKHAEVPCAKCHPGEGKGRRFRGVEFGKCEDCHADPHKGRMRPNACATCHSVAGWTILKDALRDNHAPGVFPLRGKHAAVPCASCHKKGQPHDAAPTACEGCHQTPHRHDLGARCATCHVDRGWSVHVGRFPHERTGYPLVGEHARVPCARCHAPRGTFAARFLGLPADRCSRCHADPHRVAYRTVADPLACERCHTERGFVPASFGADRHRAPTFPVDGAHLAVPCAECHRGKPFPVRVAQAWPLDCAQCHPNPHGERFAAEQRRAGCAGCHQTGDWKQARIDHERFFPLRGRHAQTACAGCHTGTQYRGAPRACAACHGDPHLGQLAATEPRRDCDACHGPAAWKPAAAFDHARARLPLEGKHAQVPCERCHERRATPAGVAVVYRHGRVGCASCHDNHHERQDWTGRGRTSGADFADCERCHSARGWRELRVASAVDHARFGFRLLGRHGTVPCAACHKAGLDLARPWPGACVTCHEDRVHRGALGPDCAGCHTGRTWKTLRARELHARTRFPLTGAHLAADCTSCHRRADQALYRDAPVQCFACHGADYRRPGIQPDHLSAGFSQDCSLCHRTATFRPARFDHATFFPLRGAHAAAACETCHANGRYGGTPRACAGCHQDAYDRTRSPDHRASMFPLECERCHVDVAWRPARADWHDTVFPITRGKHRDIPCQHCHTTPSDFRVFRCTGSCHTEAETAPEHREVAGFVFDDRSCYQCHPRGEE